MFRPLDLYRNVALQKKIEFIMFMGMALHIVGMAAAVIVYLEVFRQHILAWAEYGL